MSVEAPADSGAAKENAVRDGASATDASAKADLATMAANGDVDAVIASFGDTLPEIEGEAPAVWHRVTR